MHRGRLLPDVSEGLLKTELRRLRLVDDTPALPDGILAVPQFAWGVENQSGTECHFIAPPKGALAIARVLNACLDLPAR
jgi:hypothetical protein